MSNEVQTVDGRGKCEYIPFGGQDKVKLSIEIVKNLICVKTKSGKTCSDQDAIKFLALCQARRLSPFEGDCFLIGYDGKDGPQFSLITAHQAFLKRAELNAEYDGMKSGVIIKNEEGMIEQTEGDFMLQGQELLGGWACVFFKGRSNPMLKRVNLRRFQKSWGIWQDDPAGMIVKCAEADALRSSFPTMLGGLYTREEVGNEAQVAKVEKPIFTSPVVTSEPVPVEVLPPESKPKKREMHPPPHNTAKPKEPETPLKQLRDKIKEANMAESAVLEFMATVGLASGDEVTLDAVALNDASAIDTILDQWDEFVTKMEEKQ